MNAAAIRPNHTASFQKTTAPAQAPVQTAGEDFDGDKMTWGQAGRGLIGAVIGAGIESVGMTASSLVRLPGAVGRTYKALIGTEMLGPVLKTTIGAALLPVAVAVPVLVAVGSAGFGMFRGFTEAAEHGLGAAISESGKDVKKFHETISGTALREALKEFEEAKLEPGKEPYEIKIIEGAKGLAAGATAAVVDGVGVGAVTLVNTPRGVIKAASEIWKSDSSLPTKTVATVLIPVGAALATPLGTVGGAIYGLVMGTKNGYTDGYGAAVGKSVEAVGDYSKMVNEALD